VSDGELNLPSEAATRVHAARLAMAQFVVHLERALMQLRLEGRDDLARRLDTTAELGRAGLIRVKSVERDLAEGA
jgi:hypothetical protein